MPCPVIKRTSDRLACRSTIGRIAGTAVYVAAGSRDIVFLPRHELRNKITTRNWNYPRITIAPWGDRGIVCVSMCTEAKAVPQLTVRRHAQLFADFLVDSPGKAPNVLYSTRRNGRIRVSPQKKEGKKTCRAHRNAILDNGWNKRPGKTRELMGEIIVMKCHCSFVDNATGTINFHASNFIYRIYRIVRKTWYICNYIFILNYVIKYIIN